MLQEINYRSLGKRKILVAEDTSVNQFLVRRIIEGWGLEVDIANNGQEALSMVQEGEYDLVLMDIQMPVMDGIEATRHIRQLPQSGKAAIPIVALTANFLKGDREKYRAAGMNDFLPKPFNESALFVVVSNNLQQQGVPIKPKQPLREELKPDNGKLYDLGSLRGMSGGDESFVNKLVQLYITLSSESLLLMKEELKKERYAEVSKLAHKMKAPAGTMRIHSVKKIVCSIVALMPEEAERKMPGLVDQLEKEMDLCLGLLKKEFPD
ncbi:MAG: response regulator [Chitinophagaceae bacterium]|nr:response regulator [Chitinophagaceae bacterium]